MQAVTFVVRVSRHPGTPPAYYLDASARIPKAERLTPGIQKTIERAVEALRAELGDNLYSC